MVWAMKPTLVYSHDGLWVLDKPAGMVVHAARPEDKPDLLAWARKEIKAPPKLAAVNRLDKETSGLVICAADRGVLATAADWFAAGKVQKDYVALVFGRTHKKGIVRRPLQDARRGKALSAVTRYWLELALPRVTYLRVRPETGRKHQIRRHLQGIGHSVVGDARYRPRRGDHRRVPGFPGRLWLHCLELKLPDGTRFRAPLPAVLEDHLTLLGGPSEPE
jgi:23S rRNA-/tRNA-specific pseudouridylate synthase